MTTREVILDGGLPWGFRMHGGADVNQPLRISRVNPGSKAALRGIREGDFITSINGQLTKNVTNAEAHGLLKTAGGTLRLGLNDSGSPKRRQFKTVHQETHEETVRKSSVTSYSVKSSRTIDSPNSYHQGDNVNENSGYLKNNETTKQNGDSKSPLNNIAVSQRSTLSSNQSSTASNTPSEEDKAFASGRSSYCNYPSPLSSVFPEEGIGSRSAPAQLTNISEEDTMADNALSNSRSRRRRARRKAAKNNDASTNSEPSEVQITSITIEVNELEETQHDYRVDSPETVKSHSKAKNVAKQSSATMAKSKSLDDDEMLKIQELSETSEGETECQAIVSEAESEVEWEETATIPDLQPLQGHLSTLSLPLEEHFTEQVTLISPEDELKLRNFLEGLNLVNSPEDAIKQTYEKSTVDSIKARKAKKRLELEKYFLPMVNNPRYLDVISEETSDVEQPSMKQHLKQGTPEPQTDGKPPQSSRRQRQTALRKKQLLESTPVLLGTKLIETPAMGQAVCSTSLTETPMGAEVVYLNDSSDSNSPSTPSDYEDCNEEQPNEPNSKEPSPNNPPAQPVQVAGKNCLTNDRNNDVITQLTPPPTPDSNSPKNGLTTMLVEDKKVVRNPSTLIETTLSHLLSNKTNEIRLDDRFGQLPDTIKSKIEELEAPNKARDIVETLEKLNDEVGLLTRKIRPENIIYTNVISPPPPSRSPSLSSSGSSRETSLCTAKYNPNSSIADITSITKDEELLTDTKNFQPIPLGKLCLVTLLSLPFGAEVLQELADVSLSIESLTNKLPSTILPNIPAFMHKQNLTNSKTDDDNSSSNNFPVQPNTEQMPVKGNWVGLPTQKDPNLLICLSPTQKTLMDTTKPIKDEAATLLDLHEKFFNRRSYNEEVVKKTEETVTLLTTKVSGCNLSMNDPNKIACNRLLTIIREEPSDLLNNRLQHGSSATLPRINFKENAGKQDARLKARDLSEWLQLARQKSHSETNLTAPPMHSDAENTRPMQPSTRRRTSLPKELFEKQLQYLQEQERQVFRDLERLEEEKRKLSANMAPSRQFQADDFHISKQGDYAENKKARPTSMPVVPTEFFRQQMYEEYMSQIAEREERRLQKLIKVSSSKDNLVNLGNKENLGEVTHVCDIEDEFMKKVKQKQKMEGCEGVVEKSASREKSVVEEDEAPVLVIDGESVQEGRKLPKHLQEFVDITKLAADNLTETLFDGIWSPGQKPDRQEPTKTHQEQNRGDETIATVWTPKSASSSPTVERKEFRPVNFQSPVLGRKNKPPVEVLQSTGTEPPWKASETLSSTLEKRLTTSQSSPASGFSDFPSPRLPKAQNPTITLLQKAREGQLPRGASYLEQQDHHQFRRPHNDRPPIVGPGEIVYKIKHEYTSESDSERPRKMADLGPRKFEGIGPTTNNGMPLTLRSEVKESNQSKWYKRMYDTIHKQKPHNSEYVTFRYKQRRAQYPYTSGYLSEPEPGAYDSDFADYKYATLDRRRQPLSQKQYDYNMSSTMPRSVVTNKPVSPAEGLRTTPQEMYRYPPGRIENYMPGHSSISEKEAKEWWDEVMDIFDGWLDDNSPLPSYEYIFAKALAKSHLEQQKRVPQTRSFINQALKESGYESDSTLVFRRKEEAAQQLSPLEQKEAYKVIQKGGDVPLHGLRKLAPERPKDDQSIEYYPISPTLTRIRIHKNIKPQREIICYPVTVHHNTFADYKRSAPSSTSVCTGTIPKPPTMPPPSPPRRRSSRNNSTLRMISTMKVKTEKSPLCRRHETCFSTNTNMEKANVKYLRDKITCKLSASPKKRTEQPKIKVYKTITTTPDLKSRITSTLTTTRDSKTSGSKILSRTNIKPAEKCCSLRSRSTDSLRNICRSCSLPSSRKVNTKSCEILNKNKVGETVSKPTPHGTFGTEKRRFDFVLPKIPSTDKRSKIDKSPELLSPTEVKKVVTTQRSSPSGVTYKKSTVVLPSRSKESLPIRVGISDKAKSIIKSSVQRPLSTSPRPLRSKNLALSQSSLSDRSNKSKSSLESLQSPKLDRKLPNTKPKPKTSPVELKKSPKSKKEQINDEIVRKTKITAKAKKERIVEKPSKCAGRAAGSEMAKQLQQMEEFGSNSTLADIQKQKEAIQNNQFFQHLFLRDISPTPSTASRNSWLLEKTHQLQRRRSSMSEPSIGAMKVYLKHTRPVSDSKFKSLDLAFIRSRSASPKSVTWQNLRNLEEVYDDRQNKRSTSLPAKLFFSQTSRPVSPVVQRQINKSPTPPGSPLRSPSSRRIMQYKNNMQSNESLNSNISRSRSIGRKPAPLSLYVCPSITHSTSSIDSFENNEYQYYVRELLQSTGRNTKFKDLNHFYSDIEKVGQLEQTCNVKPRKKSENKIVDFDRWQEVRLRERAEQELRALYSQMKDNEKEKGFLFIPKDVSRYKWKRELDRGLRIKEKSVDNIKEEFERLKEEESDRENAKRREMAYSKDTYKPLWRGNSVVNLANLMTERRSQSEGRVPTTRQRFVDKESDKMLTHGIGSRIWSSLSMEQVNILKDQLAEIYNSQSVTKPRKTEDFTIQVPENNNHYTSLSVRRNSDTSKHVYKSKSATSLSTTCLTPTNNMSESDKKLLSQSLSKEVMDKISKRKENKILLPLVVPKEVLGAVAAADANLRPTNLPQKPLIKTNAISPNKMSSTSETESGSTDESTKTVVFVGDEDNIKKKVEYFEHASDLDSYVPTVYKPAESHYDLGDMSQTIQSDKSIQEENKFVKKSESCQDFKEYFGEHDLRKFATVPLSATRKETYVAPAKPQLRVLSPVKTSISGATSYDSLCRSRSLSPYLEDNKIPAANVGEVHRLKNKFELLDDFFTAEKNLGVRRSLSDSDLSRRSHQHQIHIPGHSFGYVDSLRRKYEYPAYSGRGRSRIRRGGIVSPIFLRAEDRFMPHINIISKIANLYTKKGSNNHGKSKSTEELAKILGCPVGEVEKLREKFNSVGKDISLVGHMFTSSPDIKELRDIAPYLAASWMAHRFPKSEDNTRTLSSPEHSTAARDTSIMRKDRKTTTTRPKSASPPQKVSILKSNHQRHRSADGFQGQKLDSKPASRLQPGGEPEVPIPPPKGQYELRNLQPESPRRYVENDVTIHYKTPVRQEIKECLSEDELAHRQAETMKKIYQEERRRKYLQVSKSLQELQDMNSRRHTDNFIPSQKSPIPLNRYDDFDVLPPATKPQPRSPEPRLLAKALYNFVGQTARELTFRKGDLIYVRRQVDKNWYEGELNAMVGLFPVNYVEIVHHEGLKTTPRKSYEGQARAKYNFVAQTHLELSLAKGEIVIITRKVDDNWYEGKIGGRKGIFPVAYVDVLIDAHDAPPPSTKPVASPAAHSLLLNGSAGGKESMGSHLYTPSLPNPQLATSYHAKPVQITGNGTYGSLGRSLKNPLHIETQSEPVPYRALFKYNPQNDDELELMEGDVVYVLEKCDDGWYVGSSDRTGAFGTFPGNYVEKI